MEDEHFGVSEGVKLSFEELDIVAQIIGFMHINCRISSGECFRELPNDMPLYPGELYSRIIAEKGFVNLPTHVAYGEFPHSSMSVDFSPNEDFANGDANAYTGYITLILSKWIDKERKLIFINQENAEIELNCRRFIVLNFFDSIARLLQERLCMYHPCDIHLCTNDRLIIFLQDSMGRAGITNMEIIDSELIIESADVLKHSSAIGSQGVDYLKKALVLARMKKVDVAEIVKTYITGQTV